jgi:hypothetical protein
MIVKVCDVLDCTTMPASSYKIGIMVSNNTAQIIKWNRMPEDSTKFTSEKLSSMPENKLPQIEIFFDDFIAKLSSRGMIIVNRPVHLMRPACRVQKTAL